ncbi:MAG: PepSY-like domain-containing protein [Chitinophagales bacterium]|nr:PepSY-like domain-containing protein [Chitinophagales bacterium]
MKKNMYYLKGIFTITLLFMGLQLYAQKTVLQLNELPKEAQTFISKHFKDYQLQVITQKTKHYFVKEYEVYFQDRTKIEFDSEGNWKEVEGKYKAIPSGFILPEIKNYIAKNFPTTQIVEIEKKTWKYEVKLNNRLELEFDSKGNFIKIDD